MPYLKPTKNLTVGTDVHAEAWQCAMLEGIALTPWVEAAIRGRVQLVLALQEQAERESKQVYRRFDDGE